MLLIVAVVPASVSAQFKSTDGPVIIHRQLQYGVAGELQTFIARVSADTDIDSVTLYHRIGSAGSYEPILMRSLVDAIGEYMIAVETPVNTTAAMQYYIEAVDVEGNKRNHAYAFAPFVIPLVQPAAPTPPTGPANVPALANNSGGISGPALVLGVGAALLLGALAGSESGVENPSGNRAVIPLTIISDQPTTQ